MLVIMDIDKLALDQVLRDVRSACTHGTDRACVCKFYVCDQIQEQFEIPYAHATDLASALWANEPIPEDLPIGIIASNEDDESRYNPVEHWTDIPGASSEGEL